MTTRRRSPIVCRRAEMTASFRYSGCLKTGTTTAIAGSRSRSGAPAERGPGKVEARGSIGILRIRVSWPKEPTEGVGSPGVAQGCDEVEVALGVRERLDL